MKRARIYQPTKSAMQSGKAATKMWHLDIISDDAPFVEPIMGWVGSNDMYKNEFDLSFPNLEDAVRYAERHNISYEVIAPKQSSLKIRSYSDNFKSES
jgi:hypothetical protein